MTPAPSIKELLLVAAVAVAMTGLLRFSVQPYTYDTKDFMQPWDQHRYIAMAKDNLFGIGEPPFSYRVLTPLLVKNLPFGTQSSFQVIAFVSIVATGVGIYFLCKAFELSRPLATFGMLLFFSLHFASNFLLIDFWFVDSLSFLIIVLCIYCIVTRRDLWFAIFMVIGALNKETVVVVAPLFYTFRARSVIDVNLALRTIILTLPAFLTLATLRLAIPIAVPNPSIFLSMLDYVPRRWATLSLDMLPKKYMLWPFGVVPCFLSIFALSRKSNLVTLLKFSPFLFLVYCQLLVADPPERLIVLGFPAIIILSVLGAREITQRLGISSWYLVPLPLAIEGVSIYLEKFSWPTLFDSSFLSALTHTQAFVFLTYLTVIFVLSGWLKTIEERRFSS
jgi:hypothetical protein